jgi:VanZ family protein
MARSPWLNLYELAQNIGMQSPSILLTLKTRIKSPPALLLLVATIVIVFLTLYPWLGWRAIVTEPWAFLFDPWPRRWTTFDVMSNIVAYFPIGFLFVLLTARPVDRRNTNMEIFALLCSAILFGSAISFVLECLQSWLPNRVPSKLDWLANSFGTFLGAASALALTIWLQRGLHASSYANRPQTRGTWSKLSPGRLSLGLLTLASWVIINANPQRLLFASGEVSDLLELAVPRVPLFDSGILEAFIVMAQMCIVSTIIWTAASKELSKRLLLVATFGGGLMMKSISSSWLVSEAEPFWWLTPGAQAGLLLGSLAVALLITLKPLSQIRIALFLLIAVTVLVNLAPDNPFYDSMIERWDQGRWSSLHGLILSMAYIWPLLVLTYLWLAHRVHKQAYQLAYNRPL